MRQVFTGRLEMDVLRVAAGEGAAVPLTTDKTIQLLERMPRTQ
jgi:hypothetical protein